MKHRNVACCVSCRYSGICIVLTWAPRLLTNGFAFPLQGCQPVNSAIMAASVKAGVVVHEESLPTLSDGSAGGLEDGCLPLKFCSVVVDEFILVSEDEIGDALTAFTDKHHKIIEGAAAVAIAAFMKDTGRSSSGPSVIVACGANIDTEVLSGLLKDAAR